MSDMLTVSFTSYVLITQPSFALHHLMYHTYSMCIYLCIIMCLNVTSYVNMSAFVFESL